MLIEEGIEGEYQLLRCILKLTPVYHHILFFLLCLLTQCLIPE